MFNTGDKLDLKDVDLFVEIQSVYPSSQGMRITIEGEHYYGVVINGNKCYIGENMLNLWKDASKTELVTEEKKEMEDRVNNLLSEIESLKKEKIELEAKIELEKTLKTQEVIEKEVEEIKSKNKVKK